jgi:hypothetical protein
MDAYSIVLFIHLLGLLIATGAAAVTHVAYHAMRRSPTLSEAGRWGLTMKRASRAFPIAVVLLLASGAYMASDRWSWSLPWVLAGLTGLAAIVVVGEAVLGRHGRRLGQTIGATIARHGDGPITNEVRAQLDSRVALSASFAPPLLMLAIVYVMTTKPGAVGSAAALLIASALAAAAGPALGQIVARSPKSSWSAS